MNKLVQFITSVFDRKIRQGSNAKTLHQTDRNALRSDTVKALADTLTDLGIENAMVKDGIAFEIPHDIFGSIPVVVSVTVKEQEFDMITESQVFAQELLDKEANAKAKALATEKRKAEQEQAKELAKAKKEKATK